MVGVSSGILGPDVHTALLLAGASLARCFISLSGAPIPPEKRIAI